jgi:hypothetical protein
MIKLAPSILLPKHLFAAIRWQQPPIRVAPIVVEAAALAPEIAHERLGSRPTGLTADEAATRLVEHGPNVVAGDARKSIAPFLWHAVMNPLVLLLAVLATIPMMQVDTLRPAGKTGRSWVCQEPVAAARTSRPALKYATKLKKGQTQGGRAL